MAEAQVRLRAITEADLPDYVKWWNDPEVAQFTSMEPGSITLEHEQEFLANISAPECRERHWAIEAHGKHIGSCALVPDRDSKMAKAGLGIIIGDRTAWGHGYGPAALREALRIGFEEMNLHRIHLTVFPDNRRAIRCYTKCGFQQEGFERQSHFKGGVWHDVITMAILREEWEARQNARDRVIPSAEPETGGSVRLRNNTEADLPDYVKWINDPKVTQFLQIEGPVTLENEQAWFQRVTGPDSSERNRAIEVDGHHIGNCTLHLHESGEMAGFGIMIGDKAQWGKGYGATALREVLRIGFREMGLQRIHLTAFAGNTRGIRCYEKCGFRHEGVRRRHYLKRGQWPDVICMGILREEWEAARGH